MIRRKPPNMNQKDIVHAPSKCEKYDLFMSARCPMFHPPAQGVSILANISLNHLLFNYIILVG
jgi:hypothetical protein